MSIRRFASLVCPSLMLALAGVASAQPVTFTQWNFNGTQSVLQNNPAPSTGTGTAIPLGMTNNYTYSAPAAGVGSIVACDFAARGGSTDPDPATTGWRVRGSRTGTLGTAGIGWALQAPQYTQGAEFDVSTINYTGVVLTFDWFTTNQGVRNMQVQYSIDGGANWLNTGPVLVAVANGWRNGLTYDFSGIPAVNNNRNFRVRMVSVYDPTYTGSDAPQYGGASGGRYNNASGNWTFDMVTFTGNPIGPVSPSATVSVDTPAVCNTGGTAVFTVTTTSGAAPLSTGLAVTANLSAIGLSANQAFRDDGQGGDQFAGDGIFTYTANIPSGRPTGTFTLPITVTDAQSRSGSTSASLIIGDCSGNSASRVVISQTFGGGGNLGALPSQDAPYDADYVVLYNRSNQIVNLDGWSVQYASQASTGGFANPGDQVLLNGFIQPGQSILVRMSDPVPSFNPLPTPDFAQFTGFGGMGNTGGRVALVRSTQLLGTNFSDPSIEDLVGYGAGAITFEGSAPTRTPNPSSNTALFRKQNGTQDTNQNFNDFTTGSPQPINRSSGNFLAGYPAVSAPAACAGSSVTLTSRVFPATGSTGIQVTADVSAIAGAPASVQLLDNGLNGDVTAGDGIYSAVYNIPGTAAIGSNNIVFSVTDAQGRLDKSTKALQVGNCQNSTAPVVISQVYGGGGNAGSGFNADFAEIFNRSSQTVSLDGWSLQSARVSEPVGFVNRICNLSGSIGPGEYRLIVTNLPSQILGTPVPTTDYTPAALFGMESSSGRVVLVSSTNFVGTDYTRSDVVDHVGYGIETPSFEGVGPVGNLSDYTVAVRKNGGCQDTNNNSIDFDVVLALTLPHNASSPANPCATAPTCLADINHDGTVDGGDFVAFINSFAIGDVNIDPAADVITDGVIDGNDFVAFINAFALGC